jgi:hypothetical protein
MFETILFAVIVFFAGFLLARSVYKSSAGKHSGCSCGGTCALSDKCKDEIHTP